MHFIVDENVPETVALALSESGYSVTRPISGTPDDEICRIATKDDAVILTQDNDFGEMIFRDGVAVPGLVLIRMPNATPTEIATRVVEVLAGYALGVTGNFLVLDDNNVRVRELP